MQNIPQLIQTIYRLTQWVQIQDQNPELFASKIESAETVIWNGPMGDEMPAFAVGTKEGYYI